MFPFALDAIVSIGSLIVPPAFDFIKKKFIRAENDTTERTMGNLANTKPEVLAPYAEAVAKLHESETKFFNRDVVGSPSMWVVDLRASIRPIVVCVGLAMLLGEQFFGFQIDQGTRLFFESVVSSWFGSRLTR